MLIIIEELYKTESFFDNLFVGEDITKLIDGAKVDGKNVRSNVNGILKKENIIVPFQNDLDRYCKAFILFSMTEKNPVVTIVRGWKEEVVYPV